MGKKEFGPTQFVYLAALYESTYLLISYENLKTFFKIQNLKFFVEYAFTFLSKPYISDSN